MSARLIRALQKGGCAAKTPDGSFHIWRSRDLRNRPVGVMRGAEIEALRVRGALSVLDLGERKVLAWTGEAYAYTAETGSADALTAIESRVGQGAVSLLQRMLNRHEGRREKSRLAEAAFDFRADCELASRTTGIGGMNWQALSAGTRIDGGAPRDNHRPRQSDEAARRLNRLQDQMGGEHFRILDRVIVEEVTRNALAVQLGLTPGEAEARAYTAFYALADLYDLAIRKPDRLRLSS